MTDTEKCNFLIVRTVGTQVICDIIEKAVIHHYASTSRVVSEEHDVYYSGNYIIFNITGYSQETLSKKFPYIFNKKEE